jgi:hypothetical protein
MTASWKECNACQTRFHNIALRDSTSQPSSRVITHASVLGALGLYSSVTNIDWAAV